MTTVRLSSKNQMVLPKEARERLGVGPGDELIVAPKGDGVVVISKPKDFVEALEGSGRGVYGDVKQYLKRERTSWTRKKSRRP